MADYYDRYETRAPRSRDAALLKELRGILSVARPRASSLRQQLRGIEIDTLKTRADLAQIPVLRKADLVQRQKEAPPFGGACATRPGALQHLLIGPGQIFLPEGHAKDWWNCARALYAAGIRKGDIVLNCFSYHFAPQGHMIDCGCRALGSPVIPAGGDDVEVTLAAIDHYEPVAYCGSPAFLKTLLEKGKNRRIGTIKTAFLGDASVSPELKATLASFNIQAYDAYAPAYLGIVAYESEARDALIVNEGVIVEIVRPQTDEPLAMGEVGEIVVTRLNADFPLLRFGTGDLSAMVAGSSPCGRTNMRIRPPGERA